MPMAAQQLRMAQPQLDALAEPCLNSQAAHALVEPLACKVEARATPQRRQGCGIFTPQLWKAVGLVPKQLDAVPEQCTPRAGLANPPLLLPSGGSSGGGARRLPSGRTFSSDLSFGSASTAGCVSLHMASCDINPKSLKSAAIIAYEASAAEGSDASGALSDSTGVSPGHFAVGSGSAATSGRPFTGAVPGRQRSAGGHSTNGGSSLSREAGAAVPAAAAGLPSSALVDAAYLQHTPSGISFGSCFGGAQLDAAATPGSSGGTLTTPLMGAPSMATRSDNGSVDAAAVYTGELHECLLCGLHTCFPTGLTTIRCSDCKGTMHRDCFIAHYQVVPGRRDWTYCPVHSQVLKNRVPAKPTRPSSSAHRRGGPPQHRKRPRPDGEPMGGDGAGDREFTAGPGFECVPSGSRSQRRRGNAHGGSAALAAAGMTGNGDAPATAGSGALSAAASPASSDGGSGGPAADGNTPGADAAAGVPPVRCFVSSRGRESRPVRRQYDSDYAGGDTSTPRSGSRARRGPLDPSPLSTGGSAAAGADGSPMDLDAAGGLPGSTPASPLGIKSESGSAAEPDSPRAGTQRADPRKLRTGGVDADSRAGPAAAAASRSRAAAAAAPRPEEGPASGPASPRAQPPPPHSPRSSGGGSRKPTRGVDGGRGREQRPAPTSPRAGARPRIPTAAAAPPADAAPKSSPPAAPKTPTELNDEELAMLLHQELNAPSRRRGQRMPGAV